MVGHGGSSAGLYLTDPTSPIPSHCASIVATSTVRVNRLQGIQVQWAVRLVIIWPSVVSLFSSAECLTNNDLNYLCSTAPDGNICTGRGIPHNPLNCCTVSRQLMYRLPFLPTNHTREPIDARVLSFEMLHHVFGARNSFITEIKCRCMW